VSSSRDCLSFLLIAVSVAAVGPACGGKVAGGGGGSSSSGGGNGSSSGGVTSSSSGTSTGSSSGPTGGSSSSGGGLACPPEYPSGECFEDEQSCTYCSQGAGAECTCSGGTWVCIGTGGTCALPPCPPGAPGGGYACGSVQYTCSYTTMEGCGGETCTCEDGTWACAGVSCPPPPPCPGSAPQPESICSSVGQTCSYTDASGCSGEDCECDPSGTWGCSEIECADAGAVPDGF
jgi:hypothetical protein